MRELFLIFLFFITACSPLNRISNRDMAAMYNADTEILDPQFVVYNVTDTTTRLYLKVGTENILYQQQGQGTLMANLRLQCKIFNSYETARFSDSCSVSITDEQVDNEPHSLINYVDFKMPASKEYVLELVLTDFNRHLTQKTYLSVNNKSPQSAVNYLLVNPADSVPLFTNCFASTTEFSILSRSHIPKSLFVRYFNRQYPLAAPAYKSMEIEKFNYHADVTYRINLESTNAFNFKERGIYHLQTDSTIPHGLTIFRFSDDYPNQTKADELVESLRYLTTAKEFSRIVNSSNKKNAIDEFWLDLAGNKTKGRELIRIFYNRVQHANHYFTSYHEGWKTDRGLLYIIFGEPDVVYRSAKTEDWNYSGTFEHGPVNFSFEKISNPFTEQDYNLVRSFNYQGIWFMAVDSWRQGRQMDIE